MIPYVIGDTKPDLNFQLVKDDGITPLPSVDTVSFRLRKPSGEVLTKALTVADAVQQRWVGNFTAGELDEQGEMFGELVVTFADGNVQHSESPVAVFVRAEYTEATL